MILTKYEHACFTLEKDGKLLIVDPGVFTTDLGAPENVVAVVVTHGHPDHFDVSALGAIIAHNPDAIIYAPKDIADQPADTLPCQAIEPGEIVVANPFTLEFFGGGHATIHPTISTPTNVGVMIDKTLYYPGDSFFNPHQPIEVLALPTAAPWLKMSEAFDFLMEIKPRMAFPTHDAIMSPAGKQLADNLVPKFADMVGTTYQRLQEPVDI